MAVPDDPGSEATEGGTDDHGDDQDQGRCGHAQVAPQGNIAAPRATTRTSAASDPIRA